MKVQTRVNARFGQRIWTCPICRWQARISTRKHFQTGQPLTRDQQVSALAVDAQKHFRAQHLNAFAAQPHGQPGGRPRKEHA